MFGAGSYDLQILVECKKASGGDMYAYTIVKDVPSSEDGVITATDGSAYMPGVAMCTVSDGNRLDVLTMGVHRVIAGEQILAGDPIKADANGHAVKASIGDLIVGFAVDTKPQGDLVSVRINQGRF